MAQAGTSTEIVRELPLGGNGEKGFKRTYSDRDFSVFIKKKKRKWNKKNSFRKAQPKCRSKSRELRRKPEAPFNSTQFIMEEHDKKINSDFSKDKPKYRRHRDSSLSMDSEVSLEDLVVSSDEEFFITKDFWLTYEDAHAERLDTMPHAALVQEYLDLEDKVLLLEEELLRAQQRDRLRIRDPSPGDDGEGGDAAPGEVPVDAETAAKIEVFKSEIQKLESENCVLRGSPRTCVRCYVSDVNSEGGSSASGGYSEKIETVEEFELVHTTTTKQRDESAAVGEYSDSGVASFEGLSSGDDPDAARTERKIVI